ncbi:hypothetical protein [Streptomyces antimicrobicus]|nr:hypothetical protein [Streptomyces antimicrobicus]
MPDLADPDHEVVQQPVQFAGPPDTVQVDARDRAGARAGAEARA